MVMKDLGIGNKPFQDWSDIEKDQVMQSFQDCTNALKHDVVSATTQNKIIFMKDHPQYLWRPDAKALNGSHILHAILPNDGASQIPASNPTMLPFEYLVSSQLIFCIRHPALTFYSVCSAASELHLTELDNWGASIFSPWMTYTYTRVLYDWYMSCVGNNGKPPIVLDMNDIIHDPAIVVKVAEAVGLDPSKVQTKWDPVSLPDDTPIRRKVFCRSIYQSSGPLKEKAILEVDIDEQKNRWVEEFGYDLADKLADCVGRAMPDYAYLMTKTFRGYENSCDSAC